MRQHLRSQWLSVKLSSLDIGKTLDVVVTATNVAGSTSVATPVTGLIEGLLPVNEVLPSVTGTLLEGKSLTATSGSCRFGHGADLLQLSVAAVSGGEACRNISEATAAVLSLLAPYVGDSVDAVVKASNVAGSTTATSPVSSPISGIAPLNTSLPLISGLLEVGKLLSVSNGRLVGHDADVIQIPVAAVPARNLHEHQRRDGRDVDALGIDIGDTLDAIVTATNVTGSSAATSKPTEKLLGIL